MKLIHFALLFHDILCAKYGTHQTFYILSRSRYSMAQKFKVQVAMTYCKVTSSRPVFYSIFEHFWDATKGQIISKRLLVSSDSSKKRKNKFVFFCLTQLKKNLFVRFLEESEDTKTSFRNHLIFREVNGFI